MLCLLRATAAGQDNARKRETRPATAFNRIDVGGACDVYITIGENYSVAVEALANELPYIRVTSAGGLLSITYEGNVVRPRFQIGATRIETARKIFITCPSLEAIDAHGASDVVMESGTLKTASLALTARGASDIKLAVDVGELVANAQGASDIALRGKTNRLTISIQGSSDARAEELLCKRAFVTAKGSSDAFINASEEVVAYARGASDVHNVGTGKIVKAHAKGASEIDER